MLLTVFEIVAFFTRLYSEEKSAAISKLTYIWTTSSPSYIFLALEWNALTLKCCDVEMLIVEMLWLRTDLLGFFIMILKFQKDKKQSCGVSSMSFFSFIPLLYKVTSMNVWSVHTQHFLLLFCASRSFLSEKASNM